MKMGSVSHTGESRVHESLETGPFMWTPSRCKGKLKTELLVSLYISVAGQKNVCESIQSRYKQCCHPFQFLRSMTKTSVCYHLEEVSQFPTCAGGKNWSKEDEHLLSCVEALSMSQSKMSEH